MGSNRMGRVCRDAWTGIVVGCAFFLAAPEARATVATAARATDETELDRPWAPAARALIAEAQAGRPVGPALAQQLPRLHAQLGQVAGRPELLELWGQSLNYDEGARAEIVDPAILDALLELAHGPARQERVVHAGLEHTFGYLFSLLDTSFGFKRARWVSGEIDRGLGLGGTGIVNPEPRFGNLFWNVTYLLSKLSLGDSPRAQRAVDSLHSELSPELLVFSPNRAERIRLVERIQTPRFVEIRTDLVRFQNSAGTTNTNLLIYSIRDGARSDAKLITAFPVVDSFVEQLTRANDLGTNRPIKTRYNAWLPGVSGSTWTGQRSLEHFPKTHP